MNKNNDLDDLDEHSLMLGKNKIDINQIRFMLINLNNVQNLFLLCIWYLFDRYL